MHGKTISTFLAAGALAALAAPVAADVKDGVDAWSAGDYAMAVREWSQPAADGDPDAQFNLAQAYRLGRGVEADPRQAEALYLLAANQGHVKAADNYGLLVFQDGRHEDALPYVKAAAERGDPRAQYLLGVAHFNGDLVEKDWVRAYALATLANSSGLPQARGAITQMDEYIPLALRQEAQLLAGTLKSEAEAARASDLAAADLATGGTPEQMATPRERPQQQTANAAASPPIPERVVVARASDVQRAGADYTIAAPEAAPPSTPGPLAAQPAPAHVSTAPRAPVERSDGPWKIQLGAFGVAGNADRLWDRLAIRPALSGAIKLKEPAGRLTKLLAGGFATQAEASRACAALKASGQDCLVTK